METVITTNVYLFVLATTLAILEVQIEGKNGWAKKLPTWRPQKANLGTKLWSTIMSGKEVTGYHLAMFAFVSLIFGLPYAFGVPLSLANIIKSFVLFLLSCALWDFLWFVYNPNYPLRKFKKEYLAFHHPKWFLGLPTDYWGAMIVTLIISAVGQFVLSIPELVQWWALNLSLFLLQTGIAIWFSLVVLKIDSWHLEKAEK